MAQGNQIEGSSTGEGLPGRWRPGDHLAPTDPPQDAASLAVENLQLREALRRAEDATEEFIDFVAHELKQPMTALKGYTQMLIMGIAGELAPLQRQFVDVILANAERMGKLVNDLLEVSRLEAGRIQLNPAPVSLMEILDETLAGIRAEIEARQHTLDIDIPDDLPAIQGDRERLVQVLTHLVRNACCYTPEAGHLRFVAGESAGRVWVHVADSGIGLSPEEVLRLGEWFYRADHDLVQQQPGNGLGLAITRHLVALHGGKLQVESEPNRGSTFAFTLPTAGGDEAALAGS